MPYQHRPWRVVFLALLLALLVIPACSHPEPPAEQTVITFAYPEHMTFFTKPRYEALAEAFNRANPDLRVELLEITFQDLQRADDWDILFDPAWGIDAFLYWGGRHCENLAAGDHILELGPLVEAGESWDLADFYPAVLEQFQVQGRLWGIPGEADPLLVYYNEDLFDQAGVEYPAVGWTRDDFLLTVRRLRAGLPEETIIFPGGSAGAVPFIYAHGGTLYDDQRYPTLDAPATVEAMQWYVNLALVHDVLPTLAEAEAYRPQPKKGVVSRSSSRVSEGMSEGERRFGSADGRVQMASYWGEAALWMELFSERGGVRHLHWDFNWGAVPLPRDRVDLAMITTYGYYITAHSAHPRQALRWLDFLTRQPPGLMGVPARRSVARSEDVRDALVEAVGADTLDACLQDLETGLPVEAVLRLFGPHYLGNVLLAVYEDGVDVETALQQEQQRLVEAQ